MDWGQHISEISSKATKTLRNLAFAPKSTKEVAYKTLFRPKLEYAAPIWSPYSTLKAAYSVTMNIFRKKKYFLFKSFVKVE